MLEQICYLTTPLTNKLFNFPAKVIRYSHTYIGTLRLIACINYTKSAMRSGGTYLGGVSLPRIPESPLGQQLAPAPKSKIVDDQYTKPFNFQLMLSISHCHNNRVTTSQVIVTLNTSYVPQSLFCKPSRVLHYFRSIYSIRVRNTIVAQLLPEYEWGEPGIDYV